MTSTEDETEATPTRTIDPVLHDPHYLRQMALNTAMGVTHPGNRTAGEIARDAKVFFDFLNDGTLPTSD